MTGMPFNEAIRTVITDGGQIQSSIGTFWMYQDGKWYTQLAGDSDWRPEPHGPTTGSFTAVTVKSEISIDVPTEKAQRFNKGKAQLSYLLQFAPALEGVAQCCAFGASKYKRYDNQKGMPYTELLDSCQRHITKWYNGEDMVPDATDFDVHHLDAAIWNLLQLRTQLDTEDGQKHDDRPIRRT